MRIRACLIALMMPVAAAGQAPLSAIDWIGQEPPEGFVSPVLMEPAVSEGAWQPAIDVSPLDELVVPVGLVPVDVTGLPVDLWRGSDPDVLAALIAKTKVARYPAMQRLFYTMLLSEALPPAGVGAEDSLLLARVDRLLELGAADPALALIQAAGALQNAARFSRWFDATLLTGDEDRACAALASAPHLAPGYAARVFCGARRGDWQTAALTLETLHALQLLPPEELALLDRFLSPGVFESAPPLSAPDNPDPLTFRLFETIGERLPTASLPRAFATADLRDVAGWKAQLEAAERLTRIGALEPNRLLGLYTDRQPAASGGVWDRVAALQRFDNALGAGSSDAIAETLPDVWAAMQEVGLEVPFATLFGQQLRAQAATDPAAKSLIWEIVLLSDEYQIAALSAPGSDARSGFLAALALGKPSDVSAPNATAQAIADGFSETASLPTEVERLLQSGQLGEAVLRAMALLDSGAQGNPSDLAGALATFRRVGMDDIARRAALQLMLLERS